MAPLISNGRRPLLIPGTRQRALRRPDPRGLIVPQSSAAPLSSSEIDYDELEILATWRTFEPDAPGQVRYFCYQLRQTEPGKDPVVFYKAVRLIRLTRVPRYLKAGGGAGGEVFGAMRDVLVGLREKRILFLNMIAKSPDLPLVFAYGVQSTAATLEEACEGADEAYAALSATLDGTYQQLEYQPLSLTEGESLARYQSQWNQIAMARGRPMPQGVSIGSSGILDGNRTDVENTNNQLEAFIRGMGDRSFMLNLITAPIGMDEMSSAWRNISKDLSKVRSDQQGSRGVTAGIALPLGTGVSMGDGTGTTHGVTGTHGVGASDGLSSSETLGSSYTHTDGTSASQSQTNTQGTSQSVSDSHTVGTTHGQSVSAGESTSVSDGSSRSDSTSAGTSLSQGTSQGTNQGTSETLQQGVSSSDGTSYSEGRSQSTSQGVTASESQSESRGASVGSSNTLTQGQSMTESVGTSKGASLANGLTAGSNWGQSAGTSINAGQSLSSGWNQSLSESLNQAWNQSWGEGTSRGGNSSSTDSGQLSAGLLGMNSGVGESNGQGLNSGVNQSNGGGVSQTQGGTNSHGVSNTAGTNFSQGHNVGETQGGSLSNSQTATNSVGSSQSLSQGASLSSAVGQSASQSASVGTSIGQSLSMSETAGLSQSAAQSHTTGTSAAHSQGVSQGASQGQSQTAGVSQGTGQTLGQSQTLGTSNSMSQGQSLSQSVSDGRTVGTGNSQSVAQGVSTGTSASDAKGVSASNTSGASSALSQQQALSDAWMVAASRQASTTGSLGVVPSIGATVSKQTFNEGKRIVGDILEAQMKRYLDGIEGGGMLYQMSLVCPDRETLLGASSLLKAAFWGPGGDKSRLPSPFHTVVVEDEDEARRLLTHAAAFSSYQKREPMMKLIEPWVYSSFLTTGEASVFCHPPTAEAIGLMANTDSMPVLAMPANRAERDMYVGRIVNGERGRVSEQRFGVDLSELTHILIQGTTGSGKTTTMMRVLEQATRLSKTFVTTPTVENPVVESRTVSAGVLALDWMQNFRDLAAVVPADRFQLFSVSNPELGAFRFNPLEVPHPSMDPAQWLGAQADQLSSSFGLGEFGRSLISESLDELYRANRLAPYELRPARLAADGSGVVESPAIILPAVGEHELTEDEIGFNEHGERVANVYTCSRLSRLVGLPEVATIIARMISEAGTQDAGRLQGTDIRNRLQSVWRRLQYYAPGGPGYQMVACDPSLAERQCMGVTDLIDPDRGLVTVIETDGLDLENRRVVLGSVILAVYRYGLHAGKGAFDHHGKGPGTFIVLEEAHELFGEAADGEDRVSANMRAHLYESLFRRARATGLRLVAMTQNCGYVPTAITSMTTTVFAHRTYDDEDRKRLASLFGWERTSLGGGHLREFRYLTEIPKGYCIVRLDAQESYLESAPIQILVDPPGLPPVTDAQLAAHARAREASGRV